jgi:hypothetical protein
MLRCESTAYTRFVLVTRVRRSVACACSNGAQGAQVCGADGVFGPCSCDSEFLRIRNGMVGTWQGIQADPWTPSFQVVITFTADGHYSSACNQASCPAPVFYWGIDPDSPLKTYRLRDLLADGTATGDLAVVFGPNNAQTGELDAVVLSSDGGKLAFQFWDTWAGRIGPVTFALTRAQ